MANSKLFLAIVVSIFVLVLLSTTVLSHEGDGIDSTLPSNMQKLVKYQHEQADFYLRNLSFIIAFLAGILGILTPCSLAILPAFFAYTFKEKKEITKMTFMFFLGFAPVFIMFGLIATFLGKSISLFQQGNRFLVIISGIVLIIFGLMTLFGKGFSGFKFKKQTSRTKLGTFLFGVLFAVGFTACMGPILVGIVLIAGILQNYFYAGFLMLFYSLGLFVPLFLVSFFFDKYKFSSYLNKINRKLGFPVASVIAGGLLISLGLVFIIYGGTYITNNLGLGGLTVFIYSIQEKLVSLKFINIFGTLVLVGFLIMLWKFLKRGRINKFGKLKKQYGK